MILYVFVEWVGLEVANLGVYNGGWNDVVFGCVDHDGILVVEFGRHTTAHSCD